MEETKLTLTNLLIVLSILFSIGGAFNVGFTGFWMAVPFMLLLGFLTFKKSRKEALNNFLNNYSSSSLEISDSAISTKNNIAIIFKFRKEQKIDIKGVYNYGAIDSSNANYLITKFGNIGEDAVRQGNIRVLPNTPIQSNWSKYLGNLMYWPVFPIILLTGFK